MRRSVPLLMTIIGVILLLALGTWQMQRLQWKSYLMQEISASMEGDIQTLPYAFAPEDWYFKRVKLHGVFDHTNEIHLFAGARFKGDSLGYYLLTPLERWDGSMVLVNRGWVPADKKQQETRPETLTPGDVTVTGMVIEKEKSSWFTPANDINDNVWIWVDHQAIRDTTGYDLPSVTIRVMQDSTSSSSSTTLPRKNNWDISSIRNDHLQYAITWYTLAIILVVIYMLYRRKETAHGNTLP